MLHSAHWDDNVQLEGKRVAVIGSGSSAVQIIPTIQPSKFVGTCLKEDSDNCNRGFVTEMLHS
jgi:hypothetical protein